MDFNPVRGEAKVTLRGCEFVLAATMRGLGKLSEKIDPDLGLPDFYRRLSKPTLPAMITALETLVQSGVDPDGKSIDNPGAIAVDLLSADDGVAVQQALMKVMMAHVGSNQGRDAGKEEAAAAA